MTAKKTINQNLFDFIILHYANLEYIDQFLDDNDISDIMYFDAQSVGTEFIITTPLPIVETVVEVTVVAEPVPTGTKRNNQNIFDFVISHYGNLEFLSLFLEDNNIDDILHFGLQDVGTKLTITPQSNRVIKAYNGYEIATGSNPPIGDYSDDFNEDFFI